MKCSNCGATFTADEIPRGVCKFCGAVLRAGPVGTVGAQVDELLASLGIPPGSPAMQHIQSALATQQSFSAGGMIYKTLAEMPPEARVALMHSLLAQHRAMMGAAPGAAFAARPVARRKSSGCGCFFALMVLVVAGGVAAYLYYLPH
jgi:hypothetical protein